MKSAWARAIEPTWGRLLVFMLLIPNPIQAQRAVLLGPKPTPEQAAATFARLTSITNRTNAFSCDCPMGPTVVIIGTVSSKDWPTPAPLRRLDGSLLTSPPWRMTVYTRHRR